MHNHGPVSGPLSNNTAYSKDPRTLGMLELIGAEGEDVGSALEAACLPSSHSGGQQERHGNYGH